jgi:PhzF family phenazine biosynthesis protein
VRPRASCPLSVVDAFTGRAFAGNPAAVVRLGPGRWPPEAWMRSVAGELRLSETAFARPLPERGKGERALRRFTPVLEDDLCGHATLATAHLIATTTPGPRQVGVQP